jgi:hypothetical protein
MTLFVNEYIIIFYNKIEYFAKFLIYDLLMEIWSNTNWRFEFSPIQSYKINS